MDRKQYRIKFNTMPSIYWDLTAKISHLQRRIIVYSIMYYHLDESCVTDLQYDGISQQLVEMMAQATEQQLKDTRYYYAMYDFDGSTGFDIPGRLTVQDYNICYGIAVHTLQQWHKEVGK